MVNRRMTARQVLAIVRKIARDKSLTVNELPGRGKGSHRIYLLLDQSGNEVGRFGLTDHPRDLSWTVLRNTEDGLAHPQGEKWTEK